MRRIGVALVACLLAAALPSSLAACKAPSDSSTQPPASLPVVAAEAISSVPAQLPDGSSYTLRYAVDAHRSIGVAVSTDGATFAVVDVRDGAVVGVLRSLPSDAGPSFDGFVRDGERLYWVETTVEGSQLWSAPVTGSAGGAELVVADLGSIYLSGSAYDVIVADGLISWAVVDGLETPGTEIRTAPLTGGDVTVRRHDGAWRQTQRPWLTVAAAEAAGLLNPQTGQRLMFPTADQERAHCAPAWCRVTLTDGDEALGLELAAPEGGQRKRIAGPGVRFLTVDPAPLGRYELLSDTSEVPAGQMRLLLYDVSRETTSFVDTGPVALVSVRDRYAWWRSGTATDPVWRLLDLGALAA